MRETIYREEAIEAVLSDLKLVGDFDLDRGIKRACIRRASWRIEDVPSADRPQEWIPCSERLPKENTEVLMSLEWGVDIGEYRNGEWHSEWINHYDDGNVLAWMPLPEPWKGDDDGEDIQSEVE